MREQGNIRAKYGERAREFAAQQGWIPSQGHTPVPAMTQVWLSEHEDFPVYALDEAPPPAWLSNRQVSISAQTAQRWKEAEQAYRQAQTEMAAAYQATQPD